MFSFCEAVSANGCIHLHIFCSLQRHGQEGSTPRGSIGGSPGSGHAMGGQGIGSGSGSGVGVGVGVGIGLGV